MTKQATATKPICHLDGAETHYLPAYLAEKHGMSVEEYLTRFPDAEMESEAVAAAYRASVKDVRRSLPPPVEELTVELAGFTMPVNWDVPEDACLPLPPHYRVPQEGPLADDVRRAARYFVCGRSFWEHGPPGSGKDAWPSALCALTRTPSEIFPVNPDVDIMSWFFDKTFAAGKTEWVFGNLFKALVHGYESPVSGRRVPMTIVLSDFDRAGSSQAEAIRLVSDSIQGRVKGPRGETYPVLPGTRIIITANTMGRGDPTGKCISANILDTSILDRIERKVEFHPMEWGDEEPIIRAKFPLFAERCGNLFKQLGEAVKALRTAVANNNLMAEFSHRGLCSWIGDCEDILRLSTGPVADVLKEGFKSYADGLPDIDTKVVAQALVDPHLTGGALPRGSVKGLEATPLSL